MKCGYLSVPLPGRGQAPPVPYTVGRPMGINLSWEAGQEEGF